MENINKQQYNLEERIRYWEDAVLAAVYKLEQNKVEDLEYINLVRKLQYASKRLEILKFLKLREQKPLSK